MVVPFRPFAVLAFAATPAFASVAIPAVQLPTFNCNAAAAGGTINYGDALGFSPDLGFGGSIDDPGINFLKMSCVSQVGAPSGFTDSLDKKRPGDNKVDYLVVKLEQVFISSLKIDTENPFDVKFGSELKIFSDGETENKEYRSLWDVTMLFHKYDGELKLAGDYKFFLGFEIDSANKFVDDASFKLDNGQIVFDPTNPGDGYVSLYTTPQVPVPEPETLMLLGTGLAGIGTAARRRLGW